MLDQGQAVIEWSRILSITKTSITKTNILSIPSKTAQELAALSTPAECNAVVEREINAALTYIADHGGDERYFGNAGLVAELAETFDRYYAKGESV